jgi:hypothetical protein
MAIQPSDRPAGSAHQLRFTGSLAEGVALATFPKTNATFPSGVADGSTVGARFLLADATALTNTEKKFPSNVYDDSQPAAASPHAPVATSLVAGVTNAGESDISLRTWAQNLRIVVNSKAANILTVDLSGVKVVLDGATSGLGLSSGLPVVIIPMTLTDNQTASAIDFVFEVPATGSR